MGARWSHPPMRSRSGTNYQVFSFARMTVKIRNFSLPAFLRHATGNTLVMRHADSNLAKPEPTMDSSVGVRFGSCLSNTLGPNWLPDRYLTTRNDRARSDNPQIEGPRSLSSFQIGFGTWLSCDGHRLFNRTFVFSKKPGRWGPLYTIGSKSNCGSYTRYQQSHVDSLA